MKELVSEDPGRTGFLAQNIGRKSVAAIYARKDNPHGGIYVYPTGWVFFEEKDDPDKQWWIKVDAGTANIQVVEFYHTPETGERTFL